jgi:hypothetical protein
LEVAEEDKETHLLVQQVLLAVLVEEAVTQTKVVALLLLVKVTMVHLVH